MSEILAQSIEGNEKIESKALGKALPATTAKPTSDVGGGLESGNSFEDKYEIVEEKKWVSSAETLFLCKRKSDGEILVAKRFSKRYKMYYDYEVSIHKLIEATRDKDPDNLNAKHIVRAMDYKLSKDLQWEYIIMEYLNGFNLGQVKYSLNQLPSLLRQGCLALELLERSKVVHCDMKPENIMLCDDRLVLIDFGRSCRINEIPHLMHHPDSIYYAPEMFGDKICSPKSDLFGLAIILFNCLKISDVSVPLIDEPIVKLSLDLMDQMLKLVPSERLSANDALLELQSKPIESKESESIESKISRLQARNMEHKAFVDLW